MSDIRPTGPLIVVLDHAGRIASCNRQFLQFAGRMSDAAQHADFSSLIVPAEARGDFQSILQDIRNGAGEDARTDVWIAADGERRRVQWWPASLQGEPGSPPVVVITAFDLSVDCQTWERSAEHEAKLQSILDTAVDGIVTIDERGIIESVNRATEKIFMYAASELIGQNVKVLMPGPYRQQHDTYLSNYLATGEKKIIGIGREVEGRRKDGSTFPLDLAVSEFHVTGRRHFVGIMRDISGRKDAEREARRHLEELAHAGRLSALGEMATGIAHEVNQPLTAIVSYAQACLNMLEKGKVDDALLQDTLTQIAAQGRRAGDIVHHLRRLVRKDGSAHGRIDLNATVRAVLDLLAHELKGAGVELELALDARLPVVHADRVQIEQVILNLLRNGIDALMDKPAGTRRLFVTTRSALRGAVEVRVKDSGRGIGGEDTERLFEPFYTTKRGGLGVGLSISRSIIESHGGRLGATEAPDGGLSVSFTLPRRKTDED